MKLLAALASFICLACSSGGSSTLTSPTPSSEEGLLTAYPAPPGSTDLTSCAQASAHVYHPGRLRLLAQNCELSTVYGTIANAKAEPDGDFHVRLQLDQGYETYLNPENTRQQHGFLVLEPICEVSVTQKDAVSACQGYHNPLQVPPAGTKVRAIGYWVVDLQHGWNELHPLVSIKPV